MMVPSTAVPIARNPGEPRALVRMSDAFDYFLDHARSATRKARTMERGAWRNRQRRVARVYHLLAKQAAPTSPGRKRDQRSRKVRETWSVIGFRK